MTSRSLHELILGSDLRERLCGEDERESGGGEVVLSGWLQSGDWKAARALGAMRLWSSTLSTVHTLDQIALCVEVLAGNGCLAIVRVPFDNDDRKSLRDAASTRVPSVSCFPTFRRGPKPKCASGTATTRARQAKKTDQRVHDQCLEPGDLATADAISMA